MTIAERITKVYLEYETWHKEKLDEASANEYHDKLIKQGNIITVSDGEILSGYVEFWRINYEQWGRIVCGESFSAVSENVTNGHIAYVANTFILPQYRKTEVFKMLRDRFFEANKECVYFVGEARRKKCGLIKVFNRKELMERMK